MALVFNNLEYRQYSQPKTSRLRVRANGRGLFVLVVVRLLGGYLRLCKHDERFVALSTIPKPPKMKKQLLTRLLLTVMVITIGLSAHSQTIANVGGIYYYYIANDEAYVFYDADKYSKEEGSYSGNVVIPESVKFEGKTYAVTGIYPLAFIYSKDLKSVYIPKTVTKSYPCFMGCSSLTKVEVSGENPALTAEGNVLYTKDKKAIITVPPLMAKGSFKVADGVETLSSVAFGGCGEMTSVILPKSLTQIIDNSSFVGCDKLTSIDVAPGNEIYESLDGCLVERGTKALACVPPGMTGEFTVPSAIEVINEWAFFKCNNLTKIIVPETVTKVSAGAFEDCLKLTTIDINVSGINDSDIGNIVNSCPGLQNINIGSNCKNLSSVDGVVYDNTKDVLVRVPMGREGELIVPKGTIAIGQYAFYNCEKLTAIDLPATVTSLYYYRDPSTDRVNCVFQNNSALQKLIIRGTLSIVNNYNNLKRLDSDKVTVYAPYASIATVKKYFNGTIIPIDQPYTIVDLKTYIKGVSFKVEKNNDVPDTSTEPLKVMIEDRELTPDANGVYKCFDLAIDANYSIEITGCNPFAFRTKAINASFSYDRTQMTITVKDVNITQDESYMPSKTGFTYNGKDYDFKGKNITVNGLKPGTGYNFRPYGYYDGLKIDYNSVKLSTASLNASLASVSNIGATSATMNGTYAKGDAKVTATYYYDRTNNVKYPTGVITGLDPATSQSFSFVVEGDGFKDESNIRSFKTKELVLTTLQPKGVSPTCAIVAATTNMSSDETGAGFQWKKYDAPASLKPSEGNAAIYEGQLEGYLKNLQSTSYYNVRAFYKSNSGKYYYGEWITFDPSDFSFFEPTVHTYAVTEVSHTTAAVRGYVMAGTDEIISQGFEYWPSNSQIRVKAYAPVEGDGVKTVLSNGQVMTATLTDLKPETEYIYRAFVTTSAGTKYGEEQTFTTAYDPAGIGDVIVDGPAIKIVKGYYDMNGRRYDVPQHGFNIIVYSDGTTDKVIVK